MAIATFRERKPSRIGIRSLASAASRHTGRYTGRFPPEQQDVAVRIMVIEIADALARVVNKTSRSPSDRRHRSKLPQEA